MLSCKCGKHGIVTDNGVNFCFECYSWKIDRTEEQIKIENNALRKQIVLERIEDEKRIYELKNKIYSPEYIQKCVAEIL